MFFFLMWQLCFIYFFIFLSFLSDYDKVTILLALSNVLKSSVLL